MDFSEALTLMKQGKKIKRPSWGEDDYLRINELGHVYSGFEGRVYWLDTSHILADDWEVTEGWKDTE